MSMRMKKSVGNEEVTGLSCAIKWQKMLSTDKCNLLHV